MKSTSPQAAETKRRILSVARELIQETGDFDLPMRKLASRAQVSLRTPYALFGSKTGLIGSILTEDQIKFREMTAKLHSSDELENILDRIEIGTEVFARNQPFYRALYRATQAYTPGHDEEPARESIRGFQILCGRARRAGLIRPDIDTMLLGDTLTDIFASNVRTWARDSLDIHLVRLKISFGFVIVLAGVASEPAAARMRAHILEFQQAIESFNSAATGDDHNTALKANH